MQDFVADFRLLDLDFSKILYNFLLVPQLQNLNRFVSNILLVILLLQDWDRFLNGILFTLLLED